MKRYLLRIGMFCLALLLLWQAIAGTVLQAANEEELRLSNLIATAHYPYLLAFGPAINEKLERVPPQGSSYKIRRWYKNSRLSIENDAISSNSVVVDKIGVEYKDYLYGKYYGFPTNNKISGCYYANSHNICGNFEIFWKSGYGYNYQGEHLYGKPISERMFMDKSLPFYGSNRIVQWFEKALFIESLDGQNILIAPLGRWLYYERATSGWEPIATNTPKATNTPINPPPGTPDYPNPTDTPLPIPAQHWTPTGDDGSKATGTSPIITPTLPIATPTSSVEPTLASINSFAMPTYVYTPPPLVTDVAGNLIPPPAPAPSAAPPNNDVPASSAPWVAPSGGSSDGGHSSRPRATVISDPPPDDDGSSDDDTRRPPPKDPPKEPKDPPKP